VRIVRSKVLCGLQKGSNAERICSLFNDRTQRITRLKDLGRERDAMLLKLLPTRPKPEEAVRAGADAAAD